jgi:hypothetical protein
MSYWEGRKRKPYKNCYSSKTKYDKNPRGCHGAQTNCWIGFVRDYAERNNMTYAQALADPQTSKDYRYFHPKGQRDTYCNEIGVSNGARRSDVYREAERLYGRR